MTTGQIRAKREADAKRTGCKRAAGYAALSDCRCSGCGKTIKKGEHVHSGVNFGAANITIQNTCAACSRCGGK
jgi:hypothetical protein